MQKEVGEEAAAVENDEEGGCWAGNGSERMGAEGGRLDGSGREE